MNNVMN